MYNFLITVLDEIAPFITLTNVPVKDEWVTPSCLEFIRLRDDLKLSLKQAFDKEIHKRI